MLAAKAMRGAGWLVFSRFLGRFIDVFTLLILARVLTPADFGLTALATTLIVIVDMVFEVPIVQALLRRQTFDKSHLDTAFTIGILRSIVIAAIVLGAAWPFARIYEDDRLIAIVAALAVGPIARGLVSPAMVVFARDLSFRQTFIVEMAGKIFAFVLAIAIVFMGGGYWAIVANSVMSAVIATAASHLLAPYRPALTLSRLSDFAGFTGWFTMAQIVAALNWQFDRLLLGRFVDRATLGRYVLVNDLAFFPTQSVIGPAMTSVMAAFSRINTDIERRAQAFLKATRFVMLISVPTCVGISVTADLIVPILLGDNWRAASPYLQFLALSVLPTPYFQVLNSFSLSIDRPAAVFQISLIELFMRLALISVGLYYYSIEGVIGARVILALLIFIIYLFYVRRLAGIGMIPQLINIWKVVAAALAMTVATLALREALAPLQINIVIEMILTAIVGAAVYGGALLACGVRLARSEGRLAITDRWW